VCKREREGERERARLRARKRGRTPTSRFDAQGRGANAERHDWRHVLKVKSKIERQKKVLNDGQKRMRKVYERLVENKDERNKHRFVRSFF
jgi:hypothetical protein